MNPLPSPNPLLVDFVQAYPFQPATALWRAIEVQAILDNVPMPTGVGLDLGCGDGKLTEILDRRIPSTPSRPRLWIGLDADPAEIELARRRNFYTNLHCASSAKIPELDQKLDFIFSNSVLEHIPEIGQTLDEVARVLKKGGIFLFTVPSEGFPQCMRGPYLPWRKKDAYLKNLDRRLHHLRYWSVPEWTTQLKKRGLQVNKVQYFLTFRQAQKWEKLSALTGGFLYTLFQGRKSPIEIQRTLGLRRKDFQLPLWFAKFISKLLAASSSDPTQRSEFPESKMGGVLISAIRT